MTVGYDEVSRRWRVVDHTGRIYEDGFATNAQAWRWIDEHSNGAFEDREQRISNAIRNW